MTLQTIIVDGEPFARQQMRQLLGSRRQIEIRAECRTGHEALAAIREHSPDLVFLGIQMPDLGGFEVLERLNGGPRPDVIFVTTGNEHAADAFDWDAVDYLLKPLDRQRFDRAVDKALAHHRQRRLHQLEERLDGLLARATGGEPPEAPQFAERLVVRRGSSATFIKVEEIDWIEAARNYVKLHVGQDCHRMRATMTKIEAKLDPERFLRIHRSTMINIDRIRRIRPGFGTESVVELDDGTRLIISRAYRRGKVKKLLK